MSLLASLGGPLGNIAQSVVGRIFGSNNSSARDDCLRPVSMGESAASVLARAPQCAPYLSSSVAVPQIMPAPPISVPVASQLATFTQGPATVTNAAFNLPALPSLPSLPAITGAVTRALPGAGRVIGSAMRAGGSLLRRYPTAVGVVGGFLVDAAGQLITDAFGRPVRRKRRRINPLNVKALKRSVRRIKASRKILHQVEQALPKQRTHKASCAPAFTRRRKCR